MEETGWVSVRVCTASPSFILNNDSGWQLHTIHNGERTSTATSYLLPFTSRTNLDVIVGARALRVLPDQNSTAGDTPSFSTVEYSVEGKQSFMSCEFVLPALLKCVEGETFTVSAKKEIIISAGAFNTPALLLHSGIGDETELTVLGIEPTVNLPSVGKNLTGRLLYMLFRTSSKSLYRPPRILHNVESQLDGNFGPLFWKWL